MSEASRFPNSTGARPLRQEERDLIVSMVSKAQAGDSAMLLLETQVTDMQDGGMGGIRFVRSEPRRFGKELT